MRRAPSPRLRYAGLIILLLALPALGQARDAARLYRQHCADCHGAGRLGGEGPALLPGVLTRLRPRAASQAILQGLASTQMPAFAGKLSPADADALVKYIYTPLAQTPSWGEKEIRASRIVYHDPDRLGDKPVYDADPLNLFLVVETGDHHVTVLDGDRLEPITRFKSRYALHGGPKYSPHGRFVYMVSRDGWVSKYDMYNLKMLSEIRAGINARNLAISSDGKYVAIGNYLPQTLVILNAADLSLNRVIEVGDGKGRRSRVSAVYDAAPRKSFIVALKDIPELWEVSYSDQPVYYGKVHDYRDEGPPPISGPFPIRRIVLDDYLDDFFFDQGYDNLMGAARNAKNGQVINLNIGRKIADIDLPGLPHLGSGITWNYHGHPVMATPNLKQGVVSVIDMQTWKTIKRIKTLGPGFFMRSHENSPYAWVDVFFGPNRDVMQVIDKQRLEIVKTLRPAPGKTSAHVEFTRDGRYALVSIWDQDGALVVYDSKTLEEVKRIPMNKPSGKYNVYNKITRSAGTSH